jgi:inner membrane protein
MDTLTHALSGALLARATARANARLPLRARMWVGFWAAAFPDSDFVVRFFDPFLYLTSHRGWTHSVVLLPLWALGLAFAFAWIYRRRYSWREFVGVCALGIGIHIVGDIITAFGTMILSPVSGMRVSLPYTFIIDPYFTFIIVAALMIAALRRSRRAAIAGLGVLAAYVGTQAWLHHQAQQFAANYIARERLAPLAVHALPQPLSPFHWLIVVAEADRYRLAYLSLAGATDSLARENDAWWHRLYAAYRPAHEVRWQEIPRFGVTPADAALAQEAWNTNILAAYRGFTMLPALYRIDRNPGVPCVWFQDLRFASPGRDMPFRYGACRDADAWHLHQLVNETPIRVSTVRQ